MYFQILFTVVGPSGKAVVSAVAKELGSFSGQCFHLVPGDFNYEPAEFTVVITWNGGHHFAPTQLLSGKDVYDFKLKVCLKHAITACNIFSEIEPDLIKEEDTVLVDSLYDMRKQLEVVKQLVSARAGNVGTSIVPDVQIPAVKPSPMTKYIPPGYVQLPFYTGGLTGVIPDDNPDIVENHPGRVAPTTTRTTTFFPEIQMGPALLNQDFQVPVQLSTEVEEARKRPAEEEAEEEFTYSRSTRSKKKKSKDSSSSSSSAPPPPPPPPAPVPQSSAASGFTPPKKFTCIQCTYSSDRKQDYENHRNRHLGITFKCCHCKKTFYSESSRKSHIKTSHLGIKRAKCSFENCNWEDTDFGKYRAHMFDVHGVGEETRCKQCDKKFDNYRSYTRHVQECGRKKDKKCPSCPRLFKDLDKMSEHVAKAHTKSAAGSGRGASTYNPMVCDKCGKVLRTADSLRVHKANNCS